MGYPSRPPAIDIVPDYCPDAVIEWHRLTGLKDRKESRSRRDLALKAKQHLLYLGWKLWYIDKKCRWELRYTCPITGKHHVSLRNACESCMKDGLENPSTAALPPPPAAIRLPPLSLKRRQRKSEESDESSSQKDSESPITSFESEESKESSSEEESEASISSSVNNDSVTTVSRLKENEKYVSQSESEDTTNSVDSDKRGKVLKVNIKEKNSEALKMSIMEKDSEGCGKRRKVLKVSMRERCTLVSWLIKNQVLASGTNVFCRGSNNVVKKGSLSCDGIVCDCCQVTFTITGFEAHAGCTRHRPSTSILLEDGRSLLECQKESMSLRDQNEDLFVVKDDVEAFNDSTCSICGFGGDIVLCDRCPSSFHLRCLGLNRVPDGDWFCPTCCCKICYQPKCKQECTDQKDNNTLVCVQCEQKFHFGCIKDIGFGYTDMETIDKKKIWFCSVVCGNMFLCLKKLLGKPIEVADNLTWTLLKNVSSENDGGDFTSNELLSQKESKLNAALHLLYESFNPTIDVLSGRELIKDVVYSKDSKHNRLNFCGFYNVIVEKMGEMISVATVRIYGQKVAEIVFVATKLQYRGQGMCRLLMDKLQELLIRLGVGSLVLHSSHDAISTWTKSFGFSKMTDKDRCQFVDNTFLEFQNTIMCLKPLNRPIWPCIA